MSSEPDETIAQLAELFSSHPAWTRAARLLGKDATSAVYFSHLPGEPWQLVSHEGRTLLRSGRALRPDFAFRFTPASVERLAAVQGGLGDFAVELFSLIVETDEDLRIGLRIAAPFSRLVRRGYLSLLFAGGFPVLAFGAARGVRTLSQLRRLVKRLRKREVEGWEVGGEAD